MDYIKQVFQLIKDHSIEFVDFRFTDTNGRWRHISSHISQLKESTFKTGLNFDGSSIEGWQPIHQSDMVYMPDASTAFIDPFFDTPTLVLTCSITYPDGTVYDKCPRSIAAKAEQYLKNSGIAEAALMGPELEFFVFDSVRYQTESHHMSFAIEASHGAWQTNSAAEHGNNGHIAATKGGYFATAPVDKLQNLRSDIAKILVAAGITPTVHHHEVATAGQCEVGMEASTPTRKADQVQIMKYIVRNVAESYGFTATFMPKPLMSDNGSGMHVHQSLSKAGKNIFAGKVYAGLTQEALWYIGGIIKHAKALNAFTNPTTNSYKRLVPGFEAPTILAYARYNRSASIRIPATAGNAEAARLETRFPDPTANPYLAFAALLMAGIDGIQNKIDPGKALEENLYDLPESKLSKLPHVSPTLDSALVALNKDRGFLTAGGVFSNEMIDAYIALKQEDVTRLMQTPAPVEFSMYYSA